MGDNMGARVCPACGAKALVSTADDITVRLRGEEWTVSDFEHSRCGACGEEPMTLDQIDALHLRAADMARRAKGLLGPSEIRERRTACGYTQREFEQILGVCEKAVTRWEKGTVFQTFTADRLMRVVFGMLSIEDLIGGSSRCEPLADEELATYQPAAALAGVRIEASRVGSHAATSEDWENRGFDVEAGTENYVELASAA